MVIDRTKDSAKAPVKQGAEYATPEPNKINASTPYDFNGKNLTPYGGLLPVITMLEKLGFQRLVEFSMTREAGGTHLGCLSTPCRRTSRSD